MLQFGIHYDGSTPGTRDLRNASVSPEQLCDDERSHPGLRLQNSSLTANGCQELLFAAGESSVDLGGSKLCSGTPDLQS